MVTTTGTARNHYSTCMNSFTGAAPRPRCRADGRLLCTTRCTGTSRGGISGRSSRGGRSSRSCIGWDGFRGENRARSWASEAIKCGLAPATPHLTKQLERCSPGPIRYDRATLGGTFLRPFLSPHVPAPLDTTALARRCRRHHSAYPRLNTFSPAC